jgi:hypothetical protein
LIIKVTVGDVPKTPALFVAVNTVDVLPDVGAPETRPDTESRLIPLGRVPVYSVIVRAVGVVIAKI